MYDCKKHVAYMHVILTDWVSKLAPWEHRFKHRVDIGIYTDSLTPAIWVLGSGWGGGGFACGVGAGATGCDGCWTGAAGACRFGMELFLWFYVTKTCNNIEGCAIKLYNKQVQGALSKTQ